MPSMSMAGPADPTRASAVSYFYGRISRDEAEIILKNNGIREGMFLLRENVSVAGNYALSICHANRIHHYCIEHQPDGQVKIPDGRPFPGPVELINHHSRFLDGFLTKPSIPCERASGTAPMAWPGVTMLELEQALLEEASKQKLKGGKLENVLGPQRQKFVSMIAKSLHEEQGWFHKGVSREDADKIIANSGHLDGKFLVRIRDRDSFALSISFRRVTKHYRIDKTRVNGEEVWAIEDGPKFSNLMDLVAHYYNKTDGLLCKLTTPCIPTNFKKKIRTLSGTNLNPIYGGHIQNSAIPQSVFDQDDFEEPDVDDPPVNRPLPMPPAQAADMQKIYDSVPRTEDVFNLNRRDLELTTELGNGNFGSVVQGIYKHKGKDVPVAVKRLKRGDMPDAEAELMSEARLMSQLGNRYIVRMIGVCRSSMAEGIMLVLELAGLGPLHKYLKKNQLPMTGVIRLMQQVAEGMAYLESKNFVHRDLAARNVLLVSDELAKISDFGMSKALGIGNEYYKAEAAGKWPLKWYAPECIYFFKFDSKSDVWSYGVTLWEATSYGGKPYRGMKGAQIIEMIDNDQRMQAPAQCPPQVYEIMLNCWQRKSEDRPTFQQISDKMKRLQRLVNGH